MKRKTQQIHLHVSKTDKEIIENAAKNREMNVSEFIRYCCSYTINNNPVRVFVND